MASLCSELYSNKGEALGIALADEVVNAYATLNSDEKKTFFNVLL
ncbi:MAG TPA: MCD, Malonyl-CoA decarboxylase MCD, partial [Halieaceae bacterium]|nr:MCD, Malonyl-CoA decarboxylase MCD [Halieaceae bacterium]